MNSFQKVVKYIAMALAGFLAVFIVVSIVSAFSFVLRIFNFGNNIIGSIRDDSDPIVTEEGMSEYYYDNISKIYIKHGVGSLTVSSGDTDSVTVYIEDKDNNNYDIQTSGTSLSVESRTNFNNFFGENWDNINNSKLIITLPRDLKLEDLDIDAGAGELVLEDFITDDFNLDAGAGRVTVTNGEAGQVDINGGAGELIFLEVLFTNADIDCGVGQVDFTGKLLKDTDIDSGVGEVNLNIQGKLEDYNLDIEKGLGEILINGTGYSGNDLKQSNENALNFLDVEGGVGSVNINFLE